MNILVIESSPHKNGASNLLAEQFIRGAKDAGHKEIVFDVARADIHPCLGCDVCGMSGPCSQNDDMTELIEKIMKSQMMVFVTPLYYFGMSSQLKTAIDRFYSFNSKLSVKGIKTALIVTAWDSNEWTMKDIKSHYDTLCNYLNFSNQGEILGIGCGTVAMTRQSEYPQMAYDFGKSL